MRRARIGLALLLLLGCRSGSLFVAYLPAALPDVSAWEKMTGGADFKDPDGRLDYELFVDPHWPGKYSLSRYRFSFREQQARDTQLVHANEKLQWDRDGRDVRRFECVGGGRDCAWRELPKGLPAYDGEMQTLLRVYALHADLLRRRDQGAFR